MTAMAMAWRKAVSAAALLALAGCDFYPPPEAEAVLDKLCREQAGTKVYVAEPFKTNGIFLDNPSESASGCTLICTGLLKSGHNFVEIFVTEIGSMSLATELGLWRFSFQQKNDPRCRSFERRLQGAQSTTRRPEGFEDLCIAAEKVGRPSSDVRWVSREIVEERFRSAWIARYRDTWVEQETGRVIGDTNRFTLYWESIVPTFKSCEDDLVEVENYHEIIVPKREGDAR